MASPRFRLTEEIAPEDDLAATVSRVLRIRVLPPARWNIFPAGHVRLSKQQGAKLNRLGLQPGWPDYLVVYRGIYGIELKRPNGSLTKGRMYRTARGALQWRAGQQEVFPLLEAAGMLIAVCSSPEAVVGALEGWGVPLRRAT